MMPYSLNGAYPDDSCQVLWEDGDRVFRRGWRLGDDGKRNGEPLDRLLSAPWRRDADG